MSERDPRTAGVRCRRALPSFPIAAALLAAALLARPASADPPVASAAPAAVAAPADPPVAAAPPPPPIAAPAPAAADDTRRLRFTSGVSLTGLGALTVVLGSVLGIRAIVSKNDIGAHCSAAGKCDLIGWTYLAEAQDFSSTSTACFILGPLAMAVGVGLLVSTRPGKTGVSAWIAPALGGLAAGGRF